MRDYTHFYRRELPVGGKWPIRWDLLISAFNDSERVKSTFVAARAREKHWIAHSEYGYSADELAGLNAFQSTANMEDEFILQFWESRLQGRNLSNLSVCIDSTGFMRPHLMFLLKLLVDKGARRIDVLYAEPGSYKKQDATRFSGDHVDEVRQVCGFAGLNDAFLDVGDTEAARDVLIIGAGYETHLISEVAEDKDLAKKIVLLGFPSLRADMYQQNAWKTRQASDALGEMATEKHFAPASDPFATATVLSELVGMERSRKPIGHLYLSPLATKAQVVGFVLYYLAECRNTATSIIFPFTKTYERETSVGVSRVWVYTLEF